MNNKPLPKYRPSATYPTEVYVTSLREVPPPEAPVDTPDSAAKYWWSAIATSPEYRPDQEQFAVIFLNTRRRVIGHTIVGRGVLDGVMIHPSGDPTPSEADIRITRDLVKAGSILRIDLLDHVIIGDPGKRTSLRELGYFHN